VELVERLGVLGEGVGEGGTGLDVLDHVLQRVLEHAGLALAMKDLQAPEDRQAGVLQGRELPGEGAELLGRDLADRERLLPALPASLLLGGALLLVLRPLGNLGDEEALLADELLRLFLSAGVDGVLDLAPGVVHRFVLEGRHPRRLLEGLFRVRRVECFRAKGAKVGWLARVGSDQASSSIVSRTTSSIDVWPEWMARRPDSRRVLMPYLRQASRNASSDASGTII